MGTSGLYRSTNSGVNWFQIISGRCDDIIFSPSGDTAYTVGSGVGYRISINGGETFTSSAALTLGTRNHIAICKSSPNILYFARYSSSAIQVYKSTDYGTGWFKLATNTEQNFRAIHFSDENNGWAVGEGHIAFKTNDGGASWRKIFEWPGAYFFDVFFLNPSVGWIVGDSVIIKTTNGGQDWVEQYVNSEDFFMAVHFVDENYGWASGKRILNTTDGGNTWNAAPMLTPNGITDLHFFNKDKGIAVGGFGTILLGDYSVSGIDDNITAIPNEFILSQNYPNPFNPTTKIRFSIPQYSTVALKIFDVLGREVNTIIQEEIPAGEYEIEFNGKELTSGIYFYRLSAGSYLETRKMILIK